MHPERMAKRIFVIVGVVLLTAALCESLIAPRRPNKFSPRRKGNGWKENVIKKLTEDLERERERQRQKALEDSICDEEVNIAIVGAGAAGTFSAWRLANDVNDHGTIMIIEATNRIGGRLYSVHVPNVDPSLTVAEFGAFRYNRNSQPKVTTVVDTLGLENAVFARDQNNDDKPYSFRNQVIKQRDLTTSEDLPFFLFDNEKGLSTSEIEVTYFNATIPESERDKPNDQMTTVYGYPLYFLGTRNVFALAGSSEDAQNYYDGTSGYSDYIHNLNAAGLLSGSLGGGGGGGDNLRRVIDGMDDITQTLYDEFMQYHGARSKLGTIVTDVEEVTGVTGDFLVVTMRNVVTRAKTTVCANHVILAVTRRQLQRIRWNGLYTSTNYRYIDAVYSDIAYRLFLSFPSPPFWKSPELETFKLHQGRTLSSQPSRNTYYYTAETNDKDSLLMMYGDGNHAMLWDDLIVNTAFDRFPGPDIYFPTPTVVVEQALQILAVNHNTTVDVIGEPKVAVSHVWSADHPIRVENDGTGEFDIYYPSEAWHVWRAGFNYTDIWEDIIQLDPQQNVYIVGEAYSLYQGWIEGAFETADRMLEMQFGIPPIEGPARRRARRNVWEHP